MSTNPTKPNDRVLNLISLVLAIVSIPLAIDATIAPLAFIHPKLAIWWPIIMSTALSLKTIASLVRNKWQDYKDDGLLNDSYNPTVVLTEGGNVTVVAGDAKTEQKSTDSPIIQP